MSCYTPAGRNINTEINGVAEGAIYAPCNNGTVSMCCAIGFDRPSPDVCIDHGLCHNKYWGSKIWRESCTDPTWKDPACIKLFVNGTGINETMGTSIDENGKIWADVELTDCGGGMYCFGEDNGSCCRQNQGVFVLNGEQVAFDPSATSSRTSLASSSTSLSSDATASSSHESTSAANAAQSSLAPNVVNSGSAESSGAFSTGAKAGIGIGVGLGVLALVVIVSWIVWKRRQRRIVPVPDAYVAEEQDYKDQFQESSTPTLMTREARVEADSQTHSELPDSSHMSQRYELPGDR